MIERPSQGQQHDPLLHSEALSKYTHEDPERHFIGESLAAPSQIVSTGPASVGVSPIAAREDHFHGFISHRVFARHLTADNITVGALAAIPLGTEVYDTDNYHDNAINNWRFTIPPGLGGLYVIECRAYLFYGGTIPTAVTLEWVVNDAADSVLNSRQHFAVNGGVTMFILSGQTFLSDGQWIHMAVSQTGGTSVITRGSSTSSQATSFKMALIGI